MYAMMIMWPIRMGWIIKESDEPRISLRMGVEVVSSRKCRSGRPPTVKPIREYYALASKFRHNLYPTQYCTIKGKYLFF